MKKKLFYSFQILFLIVVVSSCKEDKTTEDTPPTTNSIDAITANTNVMGYGILNRLPGIWNGPITSPTALGSFSEWIVDFRPISPAQVSSKSEIDSSNTVFMGFFIVKHGNAYKMAFRNGGSFSGQPRISYAVIDSVSETTNNYFYRFSDFRAGKNRVYTNVLFKDDSLIVHVYTNKYNTLTSPQTHMLWKAKLQDVTSAQNAITHFTFPQKQMIKDFSTTFDNKPEAIYYDLTTDPYNETSQPYLGKTTVNINYGSGYVPNANKKVFILVTTQSLFNGINFDASKLKYRSRYVFVGSTDNSYTFNYMHPGSYYLYAFYDSNGDGTFSSGDWMSSNLNNTFTLTDSGSIVVNSTIDFTIP